MKHIILKTIILIVLFFIPKMVFGDVLINEIAWMGTTIDYNDEWIELRNTSSASVDLTGWTLEAIDGQPKISLTGIIPANGYFLLERSDDNSVPGIAADQIYTGALSNSSEYLKLKNAASNIVDEINAVEGWTAGNNSTKQTMEKNSTGWQTSLSPGGTPKTQNSSGVIAEPEEPVGEPEIPTATENNNPPIADAGDNIIGFINQEIILNGSFSYDIDENELQYSWNTGDGNSSDHQIISHKYPYPGTYLATLTVYDGKYYVSDTITIKIQSAQIIINEFMANPSGKDEEEEWIEVYNDADSVTDISGWQLDDLASGSKPFVFPENTFIAPKSYLVFSRQTTKIALNNDKDAVRLLLPDGIVFQEISYEKPPQGKSSARTAEGFTWSEPTPGMANIPGTIAKNEKQTTYQQNPLQSATVKEPIKDYAINPPSNKIEGGYVDLGTSNTDNKLASIKQPSEQDSNNLAFWIITIVFVSGFLGLLLVKLRKKTLPTA